MSQTIEKRKYLHFTFNGKEVVNTEDSPSKREDWLNLDSKLIIEKDNVDASHNKNKRFIKLPEYNNSLLPLSRKADFIKLREAKIDKFIESELRLIKETGLLFFVRVLTVIDGDSFLIRENEVIKKFCERELGETVEGEIRILGVDSPENNEQDNIKKEKHNFAKEFLKKKLQNAENVYIMIKGVIQSRSGKNRILAFVYLNELKPCNNLSIELLSCIDDKLGVIYYSYLSPDNKNKEFQYLKRS